MSETPPLEELIDFPSRFTFRALCNAEPGLALRLQAALESAIGAAAEVSERPSSKGRFVSIHLAAEVASADSLRAGYAALRADPGVKMTL